MFESQHHHLVAYQAYLVAMPCGAFLQYRLPHQSIPWHPHVTDFQIASGEPKHRYGPQNCFFNAATGNAFTTVLAGFAFTMTTLPKTSLLPALVAGLRRVLIMHSPGTTNLPTPFTCAVATSASCSMTFLQSDFFISHPPAKASARPPLVMGLAPAFIAFMGTIFQNRAETLGGGLLSS